MTNLDRQKSLDKKKWLQSEQSGVDCSGNMVYCEFCEYQATMGGCLASQDKRENETLCSKAWNRMARKKA